MGSKMAPKWIPKWAPNEPQMGSKMGSKMGLKMGPKMGPIGPQYPYAQAWHGPKGPKGLSLWILGAYGAHLGPILGIILEPIWGTFWGPFGPICGPFGALLGPFGDHLGPFGAHWILGPFGPSLLSPVETKIGQNKPK